MTPATTKGRDVSVQRPDSSFGWYVVSEGPGMLRPGIDLKLLKTSSHRVCGQCATKLQLAGVPMRYEGPPDDNGPCFYCLGEAPGQSQAQRPTLRLVS